MLKNTVAPVLRIDSRDFSPRDRFDAWRAEAQRRLVPFAMECPQDERDSFYCRMTALPSLAGIAVVKFESSTVVASRDAHHVADGNDNYQFRLMQQGRMILEMESRVGGRVEQSPELGNYSASLLNNGRKNKGYHIRPSNCDGQLLVISIPRVLLHQLVPNADVYLLRQLPGSVALFRFLGRYVNDLLSNRLPATPENVEALRDQLVELVAMIVTSGRPNLAHGRPGHLHALRNTWVRDFIGSHSDNPALSLEDVARGLSISSRSVQMALEAQGETFSRILLHVRLEKAKNMLHQSKTQKLRISDIAYQCGFNDVSYFNRTFKVKAGMTPRDFQKQVEMDYS